MISQKFCGLFNFFVILSSVAALPMMGDGLDTTEAPLSNDMTATTTVQETTASMVERNEDFPTTMITMMTTTTSSPLDTVTDMITIAPAQPSTTSFITMGMTTLSEIPTTSASISFVTENKMHEVDSTTTTTTVSPVVTESTTIMQAVETNSIGLPDVSSADITTAASMRDETTTMTMAITSFSQEKNEVHKQPDNTTPLTVATTSLPQLIGDPGMTFGMAIEEILHGEVVQGEVDNVLSLSSNEDTTRMATSTEPKVDTGDKQVVAFSAETEDPKQEETKEPGSGSCSLSASLVALSITVIYVIV